MLNRTRSCAVLLAMVMGVAHVEAAEPGQQRLKFRGKGPVCSCATGMGEEDIRKAWEARFAQPEITRSKSSDRLSTPDDEQRREIDESQSR